MKVDQGSNTSRQSLSDTSNHTTAESLCPWLYYLEGDYKGPENSSKAPTSLLGCRFLGLHSGPGFKTAKVLKLAVLHVN